MSDPKKDKIIAHLELKETKEMLGFVIKFITALEKTLEDGKFSLIDIPNFLPAFIKMGPAIVGATEIPLELRAASKEQVDALKAEIKEELDLQDNQLEEFIEDSFAFVIAGYRLFANYSKKRDLIGKTEETTEPSEGISA